MTSTDIPTGAITLRPTTDADAAAVSRLAELDSAVVPDGPLLLALVDGRPLAAISLSSGAVVADPFSPTAHLVTMLRSRASAMRDAAAVGRGRRVRVPFRRSGAGAVPWARLG